MTRETVGTISDVFSVVDLSSSLAQALPHKGEAVSMWKNSKNRVTSKNRVRPILYSSFAIRINLSSAGRDSISLWICATRPIDTPAIAATSARLRLARRRNR